MGSYYLIKNLINLLKIILP